MARWAAAGAILVIVAVVAWVLANPGTLFLVSSPGAPWVRCDRPFTAQPFGDASLTTDFKKSFILESPVDDVSIEVSVPFQAQVVLDDNELDSWIADVSDWKAPRSIPLGHLTAGPHLLVVVATNKWAPNALSVGCQSLPILSTESLWEASEFGGGFKPAIPADARPLTETATRFPSSFEALRSLWPLAVLLILGAALGCVAVPRLLDQPRQQRVLDSLPTWIRLGLLAAFTLLAINNLARGWMGDGFDYYGHVDYITFILQRGALPLPRDGLQMFQSPLYYVLAAVLVKIASLFMTMDSALRWLVLMNLGCGLAQIEICARGLKWLLPGRPLAQSLGLLFGGLLPMNVYFSHYVGNQALEGALTSLALMLAMKHLAAEEWASGKQLTLMGVIIGLALLAKVNAIVPAALIVAALMTRSIIEQRSAWMTCEDLFFLTSPILAIAGWYYFRNWLNFGRPFLGGWGADAAFKWWQDRGFNSPGDLWRFGTGVTHPVYAAFGSLWDGFYSSMWLDAHLGGGDFENRPHWNERFLVSNALVGLLPTAGVILGVALPFLRRRDARPAPLFASVVTIAVLGAYLAFNLRNPCFASGKAFYVIGALPCLAVSAGIGLEALATNRWLRPAVVGAAACVPLWSVASYLIVR
ncbi:hypothetical protein Pan44_00410 [Caulifigura coniformis]|uniref:Glycosyltransferase RgtA/B/C/D-like domain-containing protein n=1 Tax=Caulifigura coniformis TaxID=2527983 RepID=A0A517S7C8_9PLAN|nr:hypothetical protein [Caulifigura coniformis]QDT52034.1 hypothetical protein Pan44_00410 [Caulifigura coniformis]